jgi:hypothetical protein
MNSFFIKIKAIKPVLYLQIIGFVIFMAGYNTVYKVLNHNLSASTAFNNFIQNRLLEYLIQGLFLFSLMNYVNFVVGKK